MDSEHFSKLFDFVKSDNKSIRRLSSLFYIAVLQNPNNLVNYCKVMNISPCNGYILLNESVLERDVLHKFYSFWLKNRKFVEKLDKQLVFYQENFGKLVCKKIEKYLSVLKDEQIDELVDPKMTPILIYATFNDKYNKKAILDSLLTNYNEKRSLDKKVNNRIRSKTTTVVTKDTLPYFKKYSRAVKNIRLKTLDATNKNRIQLVNDRSQTKITQLKLFFKKQTIDRNKQDATYLHIKRYCEDPLNICDLSNLHQNSEPLT